MKKFFGYTSLKKELLAGFSTFATMVYVTAINPSILSDAGLNFGAALVATILVTVFATALMGLSANYPVGIAPGMGVSAFFTYSLVQKLGYSWQSMLALCAIVAALLLLLHLCHIRRKVISAMPPSLSRGITAGIGLFLITIALKEIGALKAGPIWIEMGALWTVPMLMLMIGVSLISLLLYFGINAAFILSILALWVAGLWMGEATWQGIVSWPPSLKPTLLAFDFSSLCSFDMLRPFFSLFLIALFDSSAGLIILARQAGLVDKQGQPLRPQRALFPDALGSLVGSAIGSATLAIHLESAIGIRAGGRTGLSACIVALLFLLCLFFYPLFASLPHFATAPVLVILGIMMTKEARKIQWRDATEWLPALIGGLTMPLTLSIYNGFLFGFLTYALLKLITLRIREIDWLVGLLSCAFFIELLCRLVL